MQQTSLADLAASQVAVVLVDFQNDFCHPRASRARPPTNTANAATAHRANRFAAKAADLGAHVIYTRQVLDLDRLTPRQRRWERPDGLCAVGSWGAELFIDPVPGASIVTKDRFDVWQSEAFTQLLEARGIDGLVIGGVELCCCVLYAVLGAEERGSATSRPRTWSPARTPATTPTTGLSATTCGTPTTRQRPPTPCWSGGSRGLGRS